MEIQEFMAQFLPNWDEKMYEIITRENFSVDFEFELAKRHFSEALKSFTDAVCAAQRQCCEIEYAGDAMLYSPYISKHILEAPQPKIEEL